MNEVPLVEWIRRQAASMGDHELHVPVGAGLSSTQVPADTKSKLPSYWKKGMPFENTAVVEQNDPLPRLVFTVVQHPKDDPKARMDHAVADFSRTYTVVDGSINQRSVSDGWYFTARSKPPVPNYPEAHWMFAHRDIGGTAYRIETTGAYRQEQLDAAVALVLALTEADPDDFSPPLGSERAAEGTSKNTLSVPSATEQIHGLQQQVCGLEEQLAAATRRAEEAESREAVLEVRLRRLAIFEALATNMAKTMESIGKGLYSQTPADHEGTQPSIETSQAPSQSSSSISPTPTPAHERGGGMQSHHGR